MQISIIIPNYNGKVLLQKHLPYVLAAAPKAEIIIVDDASTDESVSYIKKHFPQILTIEKATNSGFATSVNLGVKAASGEILLLLNSDAIPKKDFLAPLLSHFSDPAVFAVGCLDESVESEMVITRGRGIGLFRQGFLLHSRGEVDKMSTLWVNGGSGAFKKEIWVKMGGLDEIYSPFYWEDIDLSYRALKSNYKILFEPKSIVEHRHQEGSIAKHFNQKYIQTISTRNQFIFVWKNITDIDYLINHFIWLPYHLLKAIMRKDKPFLEGFMQAVARLPQILRARQIAKKYFKKRDSIVLAPFDHE